jgi:hypothetical protein
MVQETTISNNTILKPNIMRDLKYIVVYMDIYPEFKTAILFNGTITHSEMVPKNYICESGGFCCIDSLNNKLNISVTGLASSLGVKSSIDDIEIIKNTLERIFIF